MRTGEEYDVSVERLSNLGLGIAKINGFVVFIKDSCPNDKLKIKITKTNKNYANAEIVEIIEPSSYRVKPICPMQKICGACQIQFIDYEYQLELKRQIVNDAMHSIGGLDIEIPKVIPSPEIKNFRHKIQYPISETKNSKRIIAGYYKPSTHEAVNIKYCPIQPEICDKIIDYIREKARLFSIDAYKEKSHSGILKHVVIRHSAYNNSCLVILVVNKNNSSKDLNNFALSIYEEFKEISGVCINFNSSKTNVIMGDKTECVIGTDYIEEKLSDKIFYVSAQTFFQVNPKSAENIFNYVKNYIKQNFVKPVVLDAYAGISAFGIFVSDVCHKVVSIEENLQSVELAHRSAELNNVENIEIHGGDAGEFFSNETREFDVIILDPPRKGCTQKSLDEAFRLCRDTIIYVSCNPATLARDLKYLKQKGCTIESVQPFDMFCHSYHIENVAIVKMP